MRKASKEKIEKIKELERQVQLMEQLPHLYGYKKYKWAVAYEKARFNKRRYICAANQIGKSTTQIRERITIATTPSLWPKLWPKQFKFNKYTKPFSWYLYPNFDTVTSEVKDKWIPQLLPRGEMKKHPIYGWDLVIENKKIKGITFKNGYKIYFKTYSQNVQDLQSGSPFAIDCDEELPLELKPELDARLFATDGYFSMVFTATIGQDYWKDVIEGKGYEEKDKDAFKIQVSMYDCLEYEDGSPTPWTIERIEKIKNTCRNKAEVDRRVYGKFVVDTGLVYPFFDRSRHFINPNMKHSKSLLPKDWYVFGGVDIGTGGSDNHPAAYVILGVSPVYDKIRVLKCRRMDGIETTVGDILQSYLHALGNWKPVCQVYDWASKDFHTVATRCGVPFTKANKDHTVGEMVINTAFKLDMLKIYNTSEDSLKLVKELEGLTIGKNKRVAKDDLIDALRYAMTAIPIDWQKFINNQHKGVTNIEFGQPFGKPGTLSRERHMDYLKEKDLKYLIGKEADMEIAYWESELEGFN